MKTDSNLVWQIQFIILCCKKKMDKDDIKAIRVKVEDIKNLEDNSMSEEMTMFEEISMLAYKHGVYPLFYQVLQEYAFDLIDQEMKVAMADWAQSIKDTNVIMTNELINVTKLLEKHDITVISFKGPVLAEMAYGDISLRQYRDLDILIHRDQAYKASVLLTNNDYESEISLAFFKNNSMLDTNADLALYNIYSPVMLEIHWQLFYQVHQIKFETEDIWESSYTYSLQNHKFKTLKPEILLPYLCAHGSKHLWERIVWLVDIDRLIRSDIEMDWDKIIHIAKQSHTMTALLLGLSLANELFNTPIVEKLQEQLKEKKIIYLKNETLLFLNENKKCRRYFFHLQLHDSFQDKCIFTWASFFKPTPSDIQTIALPDYLSFMYYFITFFRVCMILPTYVIRKVKKLTTKESNI